MKPHSIIEHCPPGVDELDKYKPSFATPLKPGQNGRKALRSQSAFRNRGFSFLKKAGTNRLHLIRYMRRIHIQDWLRYGHSSLVNLFPALAPTPQAHPDNYLYKLPVRNSDAFNFVLVGDTGMNSPGQYLVSTALSRQDLYPSEFCMILGDVMYPTGGEDGYHYGLLEAFKHYRKPILALPGNHDWYDNLRAFRRFFVGDSELSQLAHKYQWKSPKLPNWFYAMDFGDGLRLICLDTGICGRFRQNREQQLHWLDTMLDSAGERKVLLMMHHPLYSLNNRPHEADSRRILEHRLGKANVVAVFSGHDHNYQRHIIEGRHHIIQGAGGASLHPLPHIRAVRLKSGKIANLQRNELGDRHFSFTHCRWENNQLTCTTVSAHDLPGKLLDRFVL